MVEVRRSPASATATLTERRAEAEARAKDHIAILRNKAAERRYQHVADVLQRMMVIGKRFVFNNAADVVMPHPWAVDASGAVLGHVLTIDDAAFDIMADECLVDIFTLFEVFERPWADLEQRSAWVGTYVKALIGLARQAKRKDRAVRQERDLERALKKPS
jgi:hypothetical protein